MSRYNLIRALTKAHYGVIRLETLLAAWREQLLQVRLVRLS